MRKTLIITQVLLGLALLGFLAYRFVFHTVPPLVRDPSTWKNWEGFYAVSYTGLSKEEEGPYLTRQGFADHLTALREAGYVPLIPEDIVAFYRGEHPLPAKGVLILFEGGRKDSFLLGSPLLEKKGFIATMTVPTAFLESPSNFYLKKGDLKRLSRSPYWRLASMGHEAYKKITDYRGQPGHFLTARSASPSGPEDDRAFMERVSRDYRRAASLLTEITGKPVPAYLYPFADSGSSPQADPLAAEINRKALQALHSIAFVGAHAPFNGPNRDPLQLTRLRVPSSWKGKQLISELEKSAPQTAPLDGIQQPGIWESDKRVTLREGVILLSADSPYWIRGTEDWEDQEVTLKVQLPEKAALSFFLRHQDRDNQLVFSVTAKEAALREQQKRERQTLAVKPLSFDQGVSRLFRLRIKANRAWCWSGEKPLFGPVPLSPLIARGKIGLIVQGAQASLEAFQARPLFGYYVFADAYQAVPPGNRADTRAVLLPWKDGDPAFFAEEKRKMDVLKAAADGVQVIPVLTVTPTPSPQARGRLVAQVRKAWEDPLLKPLIRTLALSGGDEEWVSAFHAAGFKVIRIIRPDETEKITAGPARISADWICLEGPREAVLSAVERLLFRVPARKIIALTTETESRMPPGVYPAFSRLKEGRGK